ncbi:MAG: hypothetical protein CMC14_04000 [Flavobacteriaceae bacterium]|nr:hypothetical protein [Flavobacteriaceae bacterium]|tara:strand:+ start:257265 stop:258095 length:831 start_codon:yes stop_codon:yes gene_type:complete
MNNKNSHIIGTVTWDTEFYDEAKASKLQQTLSDWSNSSLTELLEEVFNSLGLENKTIQIPKLEINLGTISPNDLKTELTIRVLSALKESDILSTNTLYEKQSKDKNFMMDQIFANNAGVVLINSYFPLLFQRLGLTTNDQFNTTENQLKAVHYVQYLATGLSKTEESFLPLNKILCGISIANPVPEGIDIKEDEKELMHGLLEAAIGYWPAIGETSIDGFRGNWLVRDGLLNEESNHWDLTVEKKAYDLLLNRSPFSFSVIKFPWMEKPLEVNWPY